MCEPTPAPHDPHLPRWSWRPRYLVTWQRIPFSGQSLSPKTWPVIDSRVYRSKRRAVRQCRRFDSQWGHHVTVSLLP